MFIIIMIISILKFLKSKFTLKLKATWGSIYFAKMLISILVKPLLFLKRLHLKKDILQLTLGGRNWKKRSKKTHAAYTME